MKSKQVKKVRVCASAASHLNYTLDMMYFMSSNGVVKIKKDKGVYWVEVNGKNPVFIDQKADLYSKDGKMFLETEKHRYVWKLQ